MLQLFLFILIINNIQSSSVTQHISQLNFTVEQLIEPSELASVIFEANQLWNKKLTDFERDQLLLVIEEIKKIISIFEDHLILPFNYSTKSFQSDSINSSPIKQQLITKASKHNHLLLLTYFTLILISSVAVIIYSFQQYNRYSQLYHF